VPFVGSIDREGGAMKQLVQRMRSGKISVQDVPEPLVRSNFVKIATKRSLISPGTEKSKVDLGDSSLLAKAKARPDLVRKVLDSARSQGLWSTYQTVRARLEEMTPLGYSLAGTVLEVGNRVRNLKPGDRVAAAGAGYANHAEVVTVPQNLVVPIRGEVSWDVAAFTTLGAIALQGIRVAAPMMGETFLVVGLGLVGQLTVQLIRANGCHVLAVDLVDDLVDRAEASGAIGIKSGTDLAQAIAVHTGGMGVDGVLITAATPSSEPMALAGCVTREKGRVVVIGLVGMTLPREPYYMKEIDVRISRSYGPGRYDPRYEEDGQDYPFGYVRFTEQRNMATFLELVAEKRVDPERLITHRFPIAQAAEAYDLLRGGSAQRYLGILLDYPEEGQARPVVRVEARRPLDGGSLGISFIGAGNYATRRLLPLVKAVPGVELQGVCTSAGMRARDVGDRFGFRFCAGDVAELLTPATTVLFIVTPHDSHAALIVRGLEAGKHVFVEKPLCVTREELRQIEDVAAAAPGHLLVGFNRRFAPLTRAVLDFASSAQAPVVVNIRVNAGPISPSHWIQDPEIGHGRIIGEVCHFIDLAAVLCRSLPVRVSAAALLPANCPPLLAENVAISLAMANGGIANILYTSLGGTTMPKERVEVFCGGKSAVIDDFNLADLHGASGTRPIKGKAQDKGHKQMLESFLASLSGCEPLVPLRDLVCISEATLAVIEAIAGGAAIDLQAW
jgi:predicted dehydrogenase/threonine dehydrogenase-like Zn-dependent dehydrogenase